MTRTALAIRHVPFETLGTFEEVLEDTGYSLRYADVAAGDIAALDPLAPDLLVVLGGPVGVYEADTYPFLETELALISRRLAAGLPMQGICLGAQLIAAALGARVAPTGIKEIGFAPIDLTDAGQRGPLRHLVGLPVLHWHGDAFALPEGAELLATTAVAN
ncbi:glutamine amidotransferase-related protein [Paenirhodobacter sp.]|uniref:glutamine amidotransferase-related protein n=1 Tax=Paenirhodobacter sp. TaxID=1965326 RepID=UPI003B3DC467